MRRSSGEDLRRFTRRVAISAVFGAVIFVTKTLAPSPLDKMLIIVQALLLAISALLLRKMGATYVAAIGGVLSAMWNLALAPLTFLFAVLYGLSVDFFFFLFKVDIVEGKVEKGRLIAAMAISTMLVGVSSYYVSVQLSLVPRNPLLEVIILGVGTVSGALAGLVTSVVWNKHLKNAKF